MTTPEPPASTAAQKQSAREWAWQALIDAGADRFPGVRGRIPNFTGAEAAARLLATTPEWARASTVKSNPDSPQLPVRVQALHDSKVVYMAVPKLGSATPFRLLDPDTIPVSPRQAASIRGSERHGVPVHLTEVPHIDLIVCGTVAASPQGVRVGKGGGYADLEFGLLAELGLVDDATVIATTIHESQLLDTDLPVTDHDFGLDLIVTPDRIIRPSRSHRPPGVIWSHLDPEKVASIPVLADWPAGPEGQGR